MSDYIYFFTRDLLYNNEIMKNINFKSYKKTETIFSQNVAASTRTLGGEPLLGTVSGQGPEQDNNAGNLQRAVILPSARRRVHGVREAPQTGIARIESRGSFTSEFIIPIYYAFFFF